MTEKRFTYDFVSVDCPMFYDNKEVIDYDDVVDCLNEQHETIQEKQHTINEMAKAIRIYDDGYIGLNKKNEQLKSTIKEVIELLSDEVDLFSDKATEHDICAYVELKELDNKDAYYMAISTKKAIRMLKELRE